MGPSRPAARHSFRPLRSHQKVLVLGALTLLLASLWVALPATLGPATRPAATATSATVGGPFDLVDQDGRRVTDRDFRGRLMLVYFGYTYCPDICPTTLLELSGALAELGDTARDVAFLFVSVDPERDTPEQLKTYVSLFEPAPTALTGSPAEIAAAAKAYRVYYQRHDPDADGSYVVDHSTFAYLMGRDGRLIQPFAHGSDAGTVARAIRDHLQDPVS